MCAPTHQDMLNFLREYAESCRSHGVCITTVDGQSVQVATDEELDKQLSDLETKVYKVW